MDQIQARITDYWLYFFTGLAVLVNFSGLFIPIIGPDGTLYALIAKTMVQRKIYSELYVSGNDWLDKPHFPFWIAALSFKCFGFTTWAYKLPAILFSMMAVGYTYLFARDLYNKQIALWSVLILLTAQHFVLSNNDVRAEPYVTGLIIASVYHFYKAEKNNSFWALFVASIFAASAMMTKGLFVAVPIGGAFAGHFIITKQWRALFNYRWPLAFALILIFIIPEIWCLYQQFDLHPEKITFGKKGVSGVKFFFWDSQFGRFFNTGPIKGSGDPVYFFHTIIWAFLPWSLLMFAAVFQFIKKGVKNVQEKEWYCICGALLTFFMFSASQFQLSHYLTIIFPFFSILTAQYLFNISTEKTIHKLRVTQNVVIILVLFILTVFHYFFRPEIFTWITGCIISALLIMIFLVERITGSDKLSIIYKTVLLSFVVNLYLNLSFYPSLLHYQAASEAAMWISNNNTKNLPVVELIDDYISAFEFYNKTDVTAIDRDGNFLVAKRPFLLYAPAEVVQNLWAKGWHIKVLKTFQRYWITRLKPSFVNKDTRAGTLTITEVVIVY